MNQRVLDANVYTATVERIARYTVVIGVERNTGVGTGTLIAVGEDRYVLTALHVIRGAAFQDLSFACKPDAPIIEKAAKNVTDADLATQRLTSGSPFPILGVIENEETDTVLLKIESDFMLPGTAEYYELGKSDHFKDWPTKDLEGLSLFLFGFPVDNSRPVRVDGLPNAHFLGCATFDVNYSAETNTKYWQRLSSSFWPGKDFLLDYQPPQGIKPHGFSGAGVWIITAATNRLVWGSDPVLIGMAYKSIPALSLIAAVKLPKILECLQEKGP